MRRHQTSRVEIDGLRSIVGRDLADAGLPGLSDDRRFATAYNAILQLATMVIAGSGFRVSGSGHHRTTFMALPLAMGPSFTERATYFDLCRRKRNVIDDDLAFASSESEALELVNQARAFRREVEDWITSHHPHLAR